MSTSTWTGAINNDWDDADNWSPADVPGVNSDVEITSGSPVVSTSIETVNSITDSSDLSFESAGTNTVTTVLDDTGHLRVDHGAGEGGTTLNIGGTLTNSNHLVIGNTTLSASDEVTAAALDNTGSIALKGSGTNQALLDVTAGSAGFGTAEVLSGDIRLVGDSAIEFATGEITSLAANAQLHLNGSDAFVEDSSAPGSNSALTGLASIGVNAIFALHNNASVSTTGSLVNDGNIRLDFESGDGGSTLTVGGTLTNSGDLSIGNTGISASDEVAAASVDNMGDIDLSGSSPTKQALLDVTGAAGFGAAGVLSGGVQLSADSAIEFASGEITSLARGATLGLLGNDAFIEDSSALGSNSALTGLASIGAYASLLLESGASLTTGALVNNGGIALIGATSLTLAALTNTNTGGVSVFNVGSGQALLDVTGSAGFGTAGVLSGDVELEGDSAIDFASQQITSVAANAELKLDGNDAIIEDSSALGSNSALTGLASIGAGATFTLENGASVSTTGALANDGTVDLDPEYDGGSSLTLGGALTNAGALSIGNTSRASPSGVATTALTNTGSISPPARSAARDPSACQTPTSSSTRAFRKGRPSPRPAGTRSSSNRRRISPPRSRVSGPATRSTPRTSPPRPQRPTISSRIRR
jgi:hypothetical protein